MLSARKFAFFNQTSLPPPKKGSVCSASIAERIRAAAWSALSAQPSMVSTPKSPASAGASCRELGGSRLDRAFIGADDGVDVGVFAGGFCFHQRVKRLKRFSKSAISENSFPAKIFHRALSGREAKAFIQPSEKSPRPSMRMRQIPFPARRHRRTAQGNGGTKRCRTIRRARRRREARERRPDRPRPKTGPVVRTRGRRRRSLRSRDNPPEWSVARAE